MSSFAQDKWDLTEDLNLIVENLDHVTVSDSRGDNLILIRNSLFVQVVLFFQLRGLRWLESFVDDSWLRRVVVFWWNELWIHLHLQVGLMELESRVTQVHVEQASEHVSGEGKTFGVCNQYLVEVADECWLELC